MSVSKKQGARIKAAKTMTFSTSVFSDFESASLSPTNNLTFYQKKPLFKEFRMAGKSNVQPFVSLSLKQTFS